MAAKLKVSFFVLLRVALLSITANFIGEKAVKIVLVRKVFTVERTVLDSRSY